MGQKLGVDVRVEIGSESEKVQVTAESPLLDTADATVGQVIDHNKILELPLPSRNPLQLAQIAPGVGGISSNLADLSWRRRVRELEYYVDGAPVTAVGDGHAAVMPSIDAIEEFRVDTNNLSAEYGRSSGGDISIQTRSGTNRYHGSLYEFAQSNVFNANTWNGNRRNSPLGSYTEHQFGGTIGGPVVIPKLYNGHDRTFFFFNFDGFRQYQNGSLNFATVPTALERQGNFSQTLNTNSQAVTIYDPATYNSATNSRTPFAGNIVPSSRFDPVAVYMLGLFPAANRTADPNGANNFQGVNSDVTTQNNFTVRLDQNFTSNQHASFRMTRNTFNDNPSYWAGPATAGLRNTRQQLPNESLNYSWIARPTFIVSALFGVTPNETQYYPAVPGFDPTKIPFAANARAVLDPRFVPAMSFEKLTGLGGTFITTNLHERNFMGSLSAVKIWNRHTIKFGFEQHNLYINDSEPGAPSGQATFDGEWTGLNQQAPFAQQGSGLASYLLGLPNAFSFDSGQQAYALAFHNYAAYVQDDFKFSSKLTLNLGVRWDYETPITERFNRLTTIDYQANDGYKTNPAYSWASQVVGAGILPAGDPVPNLSGPFLGGIALIPSAKFPGRGSTQSHPYNFAPRLGLAYQIAPKTVFRAGFGIMYADYSGNATGSDSYGGSAFFKTNGTADITNNGGQSNLATLTNPFPNNLGIHYATTDPATVLADYVGNINRSFEYGMKVAYEIAYNGGIQHQIGGWKLEGTFVANKGVHLYVGGNPSYDTLPDQYLSLGSQLNVNVPNPFYGALPYNGTQVTAATIPYKYLLLPYPYLTGGGVILQRSSGNSHYFAGYFKAEHRFGNGISVLMSYSVSKLIDDTDGKSANTYSLPQDGANFKDIEGLSAQDIPQKLALTYLYELPVGRGKHFLRNPQGVGGHLLDAAIGGWQVSGFTIIQSGYPLQITQNDNFTGGLGYGKLRPSVTGQPYISGGVNCAVGLPTQGATCRYLNPAAFSVTPIYKFGTSPAVLPNYRQPRYDQTNLALIKHFNFTEIRFLEVRIEAQNAFNHPVFMLDSTGVNIQNSNFGTFQATQNSPRNVQFGARFVF